MPDRVLRRCLPCLAGLLAAACSAAPTYPYFGAQAGGAGGGGSGATAAGAGDTGSGAGGSSGAGFFDAGTGVGGSAPTCASATQFVYTLTAANELYRFDPPTLSFTLIGTLDCDDPLSSPYSMAVDRNAQAWSVFTDGSLYQIDTSNAHCTATSFVPGQSGWTTFGMGFSADAPGGTAETLYVSDSTVPGNKGLARIDLSSMTLVPIAAYGKLDARAELTGTGDARLFGAFEGTPYDVAQIEKTTAQILSEAPQSAISYAPDSSNFAFAFWGGDFYLFVGPGTSTDVFHYVPSTGVTTKVKSVTFEIVGAGVSTCAPFVPPT